MLVAFLLNLSEKTSDQKVKTLFSLPFFYKDLHKYFFRVKLLLYIIQQYLDNLLMLPQKLIVLFQHHLL